MKRFFAMMIALIMIAALSVTVNAGLEPFGNTLPDGSREAVPVPKVTTAPSIDGIFDDVYNERSLVISVTRDSNEGDREQMGDVYGYAYIVFDDSNLYIYVDCFDSTVWNVLDYVSICTECGKQLGATQASTEGCPHGEKQGVTNLWDDDCVEIAVDWTNSGNSGHVSQYRISRSNFCSRDFDTWNLGFTAAAAEFGGRWGAEFAIPLDTSKEGSEIGLNGMVHSQNSTGDSPAGRYSDTIAYFNNTAEYGTFWDAPYFDYIVLGNETSPGNFGTGSGIEENPDVNPPKPPAPPTPRPGDPTPRPGDPTPQPGDPTPQPGDPTPGIGNTGNAGATRLPQGADPMVSVVLAAVAAFGAALVVRKTCFKK